MASNREEHLELLLNNIIDAYDRDDLDAAIDLTKVLLNREKATVPRVFMLSGDYKSYDYAAIYRYATTKFGSKLGKMMTKLREKVDKQAQSVV